MAFQSLSQKVPISMNQNSEVAPVSTSATANPLVSTGANAGINENDNSMLFSYERVMIFRSQSPYQLQQDINTWLKVMQKGGRFEITGRLQSGGDDDNRMVTVTIFYKHNFE